MTLHCLLGLDLMPWETHYFLQFCRSLSTAVPGLHTDLLSDGTLASIQPVDSLWLVSRDWRAAVRLVPKGHTGPVFVSLLGVQPGERLFAIFPKFWNPRPDLRVRLVAHSPFTFRFYHEMERIPTSSLFQIPLPGFLEDAGSEAKGLKRFDRGDAFHVGLFVPMAAEANLNYLVSVAHYLSRVSRPIRFRFFPTGRLTTHFDAMIQDLGLSDAFWEAVTFDGFFPMDALLFAPVRAENFIPVLCAGARGIPVLTTDLPGIENLVSDGHDGFIVPVNEVKAMGELIVRFAETPELAHSLGDRLRQGLAKRLPLDRLLDQYRSLFEPELGLSDLHAAA